MLRVLDVRRLEDAGVVCGHIAQQMADRVRSAITDLPAQQREVVTLRDVEGLTSGEVCDVLDLTEANQRVLLHRGRSRLRQVLESEFGRP